MMKACLFLGLVALVSAAEEFNCTDVAAAIAECPNTSVKSTTCPEIAEEAALGVAENLQCLVNKGCSEQDAETLCEASIDASLETFPCFEDLRPLCKVEAEVALDCTDIAAAAEACPNTKVVSSTCPSIAEEAALGVPETLECLIEKGCTAEEAKMVCETSIDAFLDPFPCFEDLRTLCSGDTNGSEGASAAATSNRINWLVSMAVGIASLASVEY